MTFTDVDPFGAADPFAVEDPFAGEPLPQARQWTEPRAWRRASAPPVQDMRAMLSELQLETRPVIKPAAPKLLSSTGGWSWPVFTLPVGDLILTEVASEYRGGVAYQVYAVDADDGGALVGFFGLHVDALREINVWRRYVADGGTLESWVEQHPDGVQPR